MIFSFLKKGTKLLRKHLFKFVLITSVSYKHLHLRRGWCEGSDPRQPSLGDTAPGSEPERKGREGRRSAAQGLSVPLPVLVSCQYFLPISLACQQVTLRYSSKFALIALIPSTLELCLCKQTQNCYGRNPQNVQSKKKFS